MKKQLRKNPVPTYNMFFGEGYRETTCKFERPTPERDYVRILAHCLPCPRAVKSIYPGVKNPMQSMLRDMCREGLLERLTDGKRNYFLTTDKGFELFKACCGRK